MIKAIIPGQEFVDGLSSVLQLPRADPAGEELSLAWPSLGSAARAPGMPVGLWGGLCRDRGDLDGP